MFILQWAMGLISAYVAWKVRKRNIGLAILSACIGLLITLSMGDATVEASGIGGMVDFFKLSVTGGLPSTLVTVIAIVLTAGIVVGGGLAVHGYVSDAKEMAAKRVAVIELRGLVDTSDTPLISSVPARFVGRKEDCLIDVRALLAPNVLSVPAAMEEIAHLPRRLRHLRADSSRANVQVVVGGVMHVPLLFYTGVLLDDEGRVAIMDWERTKGEWRELIDADTGIRFAVEGLENVRSGGEVVLAISASYLAELDDIKRTFVDVPIVHLVRPNPKVNALWSEDEQVALTQQFLDILSQLKNTNVSMVHLVLAAPASLSIRFGRAYDIRNMPPIRCYQWERTQTPAYPWGLQMPIDSKSSADYFQTAVHTTTN